jgi:hypothetical protein
MKAPLPMHIHIFSVYRGLDRTWRQHENSPVIFSEEMKNLSNLLVSTDNSVFYNTAYVAVEDRAGNRRVITVYAGAGDDVDIVPYSPERRELYLRANLTPERGRDGEPDETIDDDSFTQKLIAFGKDELNKRLKLQTFTAEVDPKDWRVKYNLGDLVTCKSRRYGLQFDARITHFKEVTENNKTTVTITLGDPENTILYESE